MAKKLRKQNSRALKRRFYSHEQRLNESFRSHVSNCGAQVRSTSQAISGIYDRYSKKMLVVVIASAVCFFVISLLSSCNVTRVVTTSSEYFQRGDTSCMIQTKTVETYDATKH